MTNDELYIGSTHNAIAAVEDVEIKVLQPTLEAAEQAYIEMNAASSSADYY